jgi:glucokinase
VKALAIDIGGTHAACAVVENDRILANANLPAQGCEGLGPLLTRISAAARELLRTCGLEPRDCAGVTLAFCGIVDAGRNRVLTSNGKYPDAAEVDLESWVHSEFRLPVAAENDARMALLGERYAGSARGFDDIVMVTLGTGVGGAAMIGGQLLRGKHFQAGCLGGHSPVVRDGRTCTCGNVGCVEAEASTWALPAICRSWPGFDDSKLAAAAPLDFQALFQTIDGGDIAAREILDLCVKTWGAGAVALVHAFDPELVVFGGGIMRRAEAILPGIRRHVESHAWTPWGRVDVRAAALDDRASLLGAVPLLEARLR